MTPSFIYAAKTIRDIEALAYASGEVTSDALMRRAGHVAFDTIIERFPTTRKIAVFCGAGNNGGDGYVIARLAKTNGMQVTVYQVGNHTQLKNEVAHAKAAADEATVKCLPAADAKLKGCDLIIDAIFGTGLTRDLAGDAAVAVTLINAARLPIVSIDMPTGIDADTGRVFGVAVHATLTITFIGWKLGLLTGEGASCAGEVVLQRLELPDNLYESRSPLAEIIDFSALKEFLAPRFKNWHKGLSGHVLIIGGEVGYAGAPHLAAEAALRVGAGLVSVATHPDNKHLVVMNRPEIMVHGIMNAEQLKPLLEKASVVIIGPGLGQSEWSEAMWQMGVNTDKPLLIDVDGLNLLAKHPMSRQHWILTPHPGEAGRLLNKTTSEVQVSRLSALKAVQQQYQGVCVLKGTGTMISDGKLPALCNKGNPGMASAGMGDVLSGVIGGLMAQRIALMEAAKLGVYLHAVAGDMAAKAGQRGTIATDLMPYLRHLVNLEG